MVQGILGRAVFLTGRKKIDRGILKSPLVISGSQKNPEGEPAAARNAAFSPACRPSEFKATASDPRIASGDHVRSNGAHAVATWSAGGDHMRSNGN